MLDNANAEVQEMRSAAEQTSSHAEALSSQSSQLVTQLNLKLKESESKYGSMTEGTNSSEDDSLWKEQSGQLEG